MTYFASILRQQHRIFISLTALYLTGMIIVLAPVQAMHIWLIAAVYTLALNVTSMTEVRASRVLFRLEGLIASALMCAAIFGVVVSPAFAAAAVLGHALWAAVRQTGGRPARLSWALLGCLTVEATYGAVLLVYWMS